MKTLTEYRIALLQFFGTNNYYDPEKHFNSIVTISEDVDLEKIAIEAALIQLEKSEIIKKSGDYWFLDKTLAQYEQSVSLCYHSILTLCNTIKNYCEAIGKPNLYTVDPMNITERDIQVLLVGMDTFLRKDDLEQEA